MLYRVRMGVMGAVLLLVSAATLGCGSTTIVNTVVVTATPAPSATTTATATPQSTAVVPDPGKPAGIWCPVVDGAEPPLPDCELYPSPPTLYTPPSGGESVVAGTWVGQPLSNNGATTTSFTMHNPWAVNVYCVGAGATVRILLQAFSSQTTYYSWGDVPCDAQPSAPSFGVEFRRIANAPVHLVVTPETGTVQSWYATLLQR